jgi:hypothetical protein
MRARPRRPSSCIELGCKFIAYVVIHAIAKNVGQPKLVEWGANHVIGKFNYFLGKHGAYGIVAIDRLASHAEYKVLVERSTKGLTFSDEGNRGVAPDRIKLFASTCALPTGPSAPPREPLMSLSVARVRSLRAP